MKKNSIAWAIAVALAPAAACAADDNGPGTDFAVGGAKINIYGRVDVHVDAGNLAYGTKVLNARNRESNALGYSSPRFGDFIARARLCFSCSGTAVVENATNAGTGAGVTSESDFKSFDVGLDYGHGPIGA